jgi:predicted HD phosphohydrolase
VKAVKFMAMKDGLSRPAYDPSVIRAGVRVPLTDPETVRRALS